MPLFLPLAVAGGVSAGVIALSKRLQKRPPAPKYGDPVQDGRAVVLLAPLNAKLQTWGLRKSEKLDVVFGETRRRQWQEIIQEENGATADSTELTLVSEEEREVDHYLRLCVGSLGLAVGGGVFPPLALASGAVTLYSCIPIFRDGYKALVKERRLRWTALDSIAIFGIVAARYFFAGAVGGVIYFTGMKMMLKAEDRSRRSLVNIFGQQPRTAWVLLDGLEVEVPFEQVTIGDTLVAHAGQMIPVDGVVLEGSATVDQHVLTGEAQPVEKGPGDGVFAATLVLTGRLLVQVEKTGADTVAAQVQEILTNTSEARTAVQARWQTLADRSVLPILGLAAAAMGLRSPVSAVAVLGSNYAPTLQVASPLGLLNFLQRASQAGILVKDGRVLERLSDMDTLVLDKTGTLTLPTPQVSDIYPAEGVAADELLAYAAAVEAKQSHPIARAILQAADERNLPLLPLDDARYEVGFGVQARIGERLVHVGSAHYLAMEGIALPAAFQEQEEASRAAGAALVYVAFGHRLAGAIELRATLRPEVKTIVQQLQERGLTIYIISGDQRAATQALAAELGIEHYFSDVLPQDKAGLVDQLQQEGRRVCFVGDGINDAIGLKKADVSVSLRGASALATNTAQIILMDGTLNQLTQLFKLGDEIQANVKTTLATTFAPGLLSLGGIFFLGTGIHTAVFLYNWSMVAGFLAGMSPALKPPLSPAPGPGEQ